MSVARFDGIFDLGLEELRARRRYLSHFSSVDLL